MEFFSWNNFRWKSISYRHNFCDGLLFVGNVDLTDAIYQETNIPSKNLYYSLLQKCCSTWVICYIRRRLLTVVVSDIIKKNASMMTVFNDCLRMCEHYKTIVKTTILECIIFLKIYFLYLGKLCKNLLYNI